MLLPSAALAVGETRSLSAEARDQNGALMSGIAFSWSSSNNQVATVVDGVATAAAAGVASITASSGGVTSTPATITVIAVAKGSVAVDKASVFFTGAGQSTQLLAVAADAQGASSSGAIAWTSSAPDRVSVDASGRVQALATGSAQIVAEANGIKSAPTLIVVATPQAGALLVTDAQVMSVGAPLPADPMAPPDAAVRYEVTLQGVAAPAPGSVVLAAESAPVAGKVVSSRADAGNLVVTLAVAPIDQLFAAYDIDWTIDLSGFPTEPSPTSSATSLAATRPLWTTARTGRMQALAATAGPLDIPGPFKPFDCRGSAAPQIIGKKLAVSLAKDLQLTIKDKPGYSRHSLEGSATISGSASLLLKAGFNASGVCEATAQVKLPVLGWVSVIIMPAVRAGLGGALGGEVLLVQGELGVEGNLGFQASLGWECGGVAATCRGLDTFTAVNGLKTKSTFPSLHGMQASVYGQFYALAGLDASLFLGLANAKVIEARIGPKQSFNLAFEDGQAARADYASSYDLKLEGVIEPGDDLKAAIKAVAGALGSAAGGVTFASIDPVDLSESPKGTLAISKTRVAPDTPVDFNVTLDPKTLTYVIIGYNVAAVGLYRKREDESEFTFWKAMDLNASNHASYRWTPVLADAGKYEFAAFVNTQIQPLPWLEVAPNSVQALEVSCFSAGPTAVTPRSGIQRVADAARAQPQGNACVDTWAGTASNTNGSYIATANVTWYVDPNAQGSPSTVRYIAEGYVDIALLGYAPGCVSSPTRFTFDRNDPMSVTNLSVNIDSSPPSYGGSGGLTAKITVTCPNNLVLVRNSPWYWFGSSGGKAIDGGLTIDDAGDTAPQAGFKFHFTRP